MTATPQVSVPQIVLEARGMAKLYGAQIALKDVTFRVRRGAVNVLIGENGAGKSTLMRLLAGVEQASCGEILMDGRVLPIASAEKRSWSPTATPPDPHWSATNRASGHPAWPLPAQRDLQAPGAQRAARECQPGIA